MKIAFKDAVESIYRFKRWLKGRSWPAARGSAVWYKLKKKVSKDEEDERKMRADKRRREDIREETMAVTGIGKIAETETNPEGEITTGDPYIEGEILRKSHAILTFFTHPLDMHSKINDTPWANQILFCIFRTGCAVSELQSSIPVCMPFF